MRRILYIFMKAFTILLVISWISGVVSLGEYLNTIELPINFKNVFIVTFCLFCSIAIVATSCAYLWIKSNKITK